MLRMRTKLSALAGAALAAVVGVNSAHATITVTANEISLSTVSPTSASAIYAAAGWHAYVLTATSSVGTTIASMDFNGINSPTPDRFISGNIAQFDSMVWNEDTQTHDRTQTLVGAIPTSSPTTSADSFWSTFTGLGFTPATAGTNGGLNEDNNTLSAPGTPSNTRNPNTDTLPTGANGRDYGVGSRMTYGGAFTSQVNSLNFAFIIAAPGSTIQVRGAFRDNLDVESPAILNVSVPGAVPEPASLGVLALGGLAMLARRRKA